MNYPINDIFEGTGELLLKHGERDCESHDVELGRSDIYVNYGVYKYLIVDVAGEITTITRIKRGNYGQD